MVYGEDVVENVQKLAPGLDHVELVLFHTPTLHNFPEPGEIDALGQIKKEANISFSVHLPTSLEIASNHRETREFSIRLTRELFGRMAALEPSHYVLHVPFTPPTLVPVSGNYFLPGKGDGWEAWTSRALTGLESLRGHLGGAPSLLVENINYSPVFLEPLLQSGLCDLCLDVGHLLLGGEDVAETLLRYLEVTREIHLHGVKGAEEHLSLSALPQALLDQWMELVRAAGFEGVLNLEVFSPSDLEESAAMVWKAFAQML